jgi:hypothetical protein
MQRETVFSKEEQKIEFLNIVVRSNKILIAYSQKYLQSKYVYY